MNNKLKWFIYISCWIASWLTLSAIINAGFYAINLYPEGSSGQDLTFFVGLMVALLGAYALYGEVFENRN